MTSALLDLNIEQGSTFKRTFTIKDSEGATVDLTGWIFRGQIRRKVDSASILVSFTCTTLSQVTDKGKFTVELSSTQTAALPSAAAGDSSRRPVACVYDIEVVKSDATIDRVLEGRAMVSPEVTR